MYEAWKVIGHVYVLLGVPILPLSTIVLDWIMEYAFCLLIDHGYLHTNQQS